MGAELTDMAPTPMREADIRPAEILAEYLRLSALDGERYFGDRAGLTHRPCPGCGKSEPVVAFAKHGFDLARCAVCDTLYVTPCPTAEQLAPLYADSESGRYWAEVFFPTVAEARRTRIFGPRADRVIELMRTLDHPLGRVTEVGAGAGVFLEEMRQRRPDVDYRVVEPGETLARQCRDKDFETFEGLAEEASRRESWSGAADLVVCFEVIEHTADSLAFVESLGALAKPGGMVLFSGLSGDGFDIRVPHHLTFLSRQGTGDLLERAGLTPVDIFTPGELDVDIVLNALKDDATAVEDPFLQSLLLSSDDQTRAAFQTFLKEQGLSSHMWAVGRRNGDAVT
jgi:SAM-dependent methyltransferase